MLNKILLLVLLVTVSLALHAKKSDNHLNTEQNHDFLGYG